MSWLSIVGIGEDGLDGIGLAARDAISDAEVVFGGERHLKLVRDAIRGEAHPWQSPFSQSIATVLSRRGRKTCVLASGDPFNYGVGATLARHIDASQMRVFPHVSAFSLAAGRLGWALQDTITLSLHGRSLDLIRSHLFAGAHILALTSDENGPAALARLLADSGFGISIVTVMEALGGSHERIRSQVAMKFDLSDTHPLNLCAISVAALPGARISALTPGLDDDLFEHDGQITKREVRALTLSALAPRPGELLWDVGSGSGSVAVEWMLASKCLSAIAIEQNKERIERIKRNAAALGVPDMLAIEGHAPEAYVGLKPPNAIFIGGGGSDEGVIGGAMDVLRPGGRLVANAVTLEMERVLLDRHAIHGGRLTRLEVSRAAPIGSMTGWKPARPVTQWLWTKP